MELTQDKIELISKIIKNDRKYPNNEDLYEDFLNETCKRSMVIANSIDTESVLEAYLKKIATTSIINVLKDSGRLRRTRSGYMSVDNVVREPVEEVVDFSNITVTYANVSIPENPEDIVVRKDLFKFVTDTIIKINDENPGKDYLRIYSLRYDKGMTQKEISDELGLSQSEISKRLYKLMEEVRNVIE